VFPDYPPVGSLLPAALVVSIGLLLRARWTGERCARRWLLTLFGISVLLSSAQIALFGREGDRALAFLQPALVGTLVALLVHLGSTKRLWSKAAIWITLPIALATAALLAYVWRRPDPFLPLLALVIALTWLAGTLRGKWRWLPRLALLPMSIAAGAWLFNPNAVWRNAAGWVRNAFDLINYVLWPVTIVVLMARLTHSLIADRAPRGWAAVAIRLALIALLLLGLGIYALLEALWVKAEDSLSLMPALASLTAIAVAMLLAWALQGWRRLAPVAQALLVMLCTAYASSYGFTISLPALTEQRAAKIDRAIQRYYARHDRYPPKLASLVPFYLWHIPQPVIMTDQTWCYQGSETYYRLGYVHRPAYGTPRQFISIRFHASAGEPPDPGWPCDGELERARANAPP
jgi:hypothetical protein